MTSRTQGPYGAPQFKYREYGVLVLVGGGVGIAPIIGMLKDIYHDGAVQQGNAAATPPPPHRIECVYGSRFATEVVCAAIDAVTESIVSKLRVSFCNRSGV
jgi:NAD(P)H-flavin reductase